MSADGVFAEPTDLLAEHVAATARFQSWTNSVDEAEALERIATVSAKAAKMNPVDAAGNLVAPFRPYAVVSTPQGEIVGRGGFSSGELILIFEDAVPPEFRRDPEDSADVDNGPASMDFRNHCGKVVEQVMQDESGGRLFIRQIRQDGPLVRSPKGSPVDYFQLAFRVSWGVQPK